jgi:hypothetical protein
MDSVSEENVEKMLNEHEEKQNELERIKSTTIEQMWLSELEILENEYKEYKKERKQSQIGEVKVSNKKSSANPNTKVVKKIKKKLKEVVVEEVTEELVEELLEEEEIMIQPKKKIIK